MIRSYKKPYLEVKKEKELLEEELANLKESQEKLTEFKNDTVFNNSIDKVQDGLNAINSYLYDSNIVCIEVNARMRTSDAEECFEGIVYEVVLYVIDDKNEKTKVFSLPIFAGLDGCMISKRACERRMDYFELTRSIAQFIKNRVNWEYVREKRGLNIIMTEEKKEGMFKYQSDMTIRMNKENVEEFKEYAERGEISMSDVVESSDNKTVLFEVLIDNRYIDYVKDLPYVVSMQETKYYSHS
ncbi:hypothetical protein P4T70_26025 [Bacillus mobilis]|uniref:hypothetical protein n=1 Tax=Bacillus mobilis TaxID=2026190 RepID=UPI002E1EEC90|nr:hypothetical protein [Bacillus mobilis]